MHCRLIVEAQRIPLRLLLGYWTTDVLHDQDFKPSAIPKSPSLMERYSTSSLGLGVKRFRVQGLSRVEADGQEHGK